MTRGSDGMPHRLPGWLQAHRRVALALPDPLEDSNSKPVNPEDFPDARVCRECGDADIERYTNLDYHQAALAADPEEVLGE
jgi:rubredoxin